METILNLVWVLLAVLLVRFWLSNDAREGTNRRARFAAVAMLILLLFPVISVTDDLMAAQSLAEDDIYLHRGPCTVHLHSVFPAVALLPSDLFTEIPFVTLRLSAPGNLPVLAVDHPALCSVQNRPPPVA